MSPHDAPWPPPTAPAPDRRPTGWYLAADGRWYPTDVPPAPGYWLASDLRWYPPTGGGGVEAWRSSRWGLGELGWGLLVQTVLGLVLGVVIVVVTVLSDDDRAWDDVGFGAFAVSLSVLANVVAFAGVPWLASRRKGLGSLVEDFGLQVRPVDLAIGFGIGFGALIVAGLVGSSLDALLGADETTSNLPVDQLNGIGEALAFGTAVAIVTPIVEELFFRGLVYRSFLKRGASTAASIAWTTLIFVLPHLTAVPEWPNVVSLFGSIAVLGLAFNLACHVTGNRLGAPIVAHMVVNGTAVVALLVGT